jgi:hypothetical protein
MKRRYKYSYWEWSCGTDFDRDCNNMQFLLEIGLFYRFFGVISLGNEFAC